ncbi:ankyrin repeat domain-containing protein [Lewinella sp. IMCC34191]|uniref:ankyrin repeat domain-containing protein n=1 Tax=Lewinella sp. IMCC34191 TaxID=2259172 RepID=UPI000E222D1C|nr:ankyrin repeat domain-containing protein [Lewinella sp. IMCC34191]
MIERLLTPHLVEAIGWTLLHTLWQAAVFALLLGLALIGLRAFSPRARYYVACAFLGAFVLCVGLTFYNLYSVETTGLLGTTSLTQSASSPELQPDYVADSPSMAAERRNNASPQSGIGPINDYLSSARTYFDRHLPLIVTLWLMGVLVLQLRLLGQLAWVQRVKSYGTARFPAAWAERIYDLERKLDIRRPVRYLTSSRVSSPFTVGWLRPVVLLPGGMLESLRDTQVITILAHELAHIKRQDFAVNVLQTLLTTFFFYHPGVWWMSARIQDEREHCCDDLAIEATGERIDYARTLVQLQEQEWAAPKLAVALGGGGLAGRVTRLLNGYLNTATFGEGVITTLIFAAVLSLAVGTTGEVQASDRSGTAPAPEALNPALAAQIQSESEREAVERAIHYAAGEAGRQVRDESFDRSATPDDAFSLLMHAIYDGDLEMTEYLLERVYDLSRTDDHGFTPLMAAASENQADIARLLLDREADVNQVVRNWTALIEAADEGSLETARLLIEAGADLEVGGVNGRTAVVMAASEGHLDVLQLLQSEGADIGTVPGRLSPLHMAANEGQTSIVRYLLDQGVPVDLPDPNGRTALNYAASEGHRDVAELLLEAGSHSEIRNWDGRPAVTRRMDQDQRERQVEIQDMGTEAVDRLVHTPELLIGPAGEGDLFTLQAMYEGLGMNIDIVDRNGYTALAMAAREGHADIVEYLLDNGANPQGSGTGCSPLFLAARESAADVIPLLASRGGELENGCNYRDISMDDIHTVSDYSGSTPLIAAIEEKSLASVESLLALGADPNGVIGKVSYLLPSRVEWQHINRLESDELDSRYELRYRTLKWTPLLEAVETGERRIVRILLENGADPNHRTEDGMTALDLATRLGYDEIVGLLNK